jgi:hypothetical protein
MKVILLAVFLTSGCVSSGHFVCGVGNTDLPPGLDHKRCLADQENPQTKSCATGWKEFGSYDDCITFHTDRFAAKCWEHRQNQKAYDDCIAMEKDPVLKLCKKSPHMFKDEAECRYAQENPIEWKCEKEVREKKVNYYDCMRYHTDVFMKKMDLQMQRDSIERQERLEALEERRQQREEDRQRIDQIQKSVNDGFKTKTPARTRCVSQKNPFGQTVTECEDSH